MYAVFIIKGHRKHLLEVSVSYYDLMLMILLTCQPLLSKIQFGMIFAGLL